MPAPGRHRLLTPTGTPAGRVMEGDTVVSYRCEICGHSYGSVHVDPQTDDWTCWPCAQATDVPYSAWSSWTDAADWKESDDA